MARSAYSVVVEQSDIVVRLDRNSIDQEALVRFLDYIEWETIRKRSQLSDEQVAEIADDVDRAAWSAIEAKFGRE